MLKFILNWYKVVESFRYYGWWEKVTLQNDDCYSEWKWGEERWRKRRTNFICIGRGLLFIDDGIGIK